VFRVTSYHVLIRMIILFGIIFSRDVKFKEST